MAGNGLNRSFMNDSLENGDWKASARASPSPDTSPTAVAPESKNGATDYSAFGEEGSLYLGLFPNNVVNLLQDESAWRNRVSGIGMMTEAISAATVDTSALETNLGLVVDLLMGPIGDSHFKVVQAGLELLPALVAKVGDSLLPYLSKLIRGILVKMGSNKYVIKQAGMCALRDLMVRLQPETVIGEIAFVGFRHKTSRVREEAINAVTMALLSFPKDSFDPLLLLRDLCPCLSDSKPRVREAAFEAAALLCEMLHHSILKIALTTIANSGKPSNGGVSLMEAFQARLFRHLLPRLNADGIVEHAIPVSSSKSPHSFSGADVEWVLMTGRRADGGTTISDVPAPPPPQVCDTVRHPSLTQSTGLCWSAGKRVFWEKESRERPDTPPALLVVW